jgi:hypothetical protein
MNHNDGQVRTSEHTGGIESEQQSKKQPRDGYTHARRVPHQFIVTCIAHPQLVSGRMHCSSPSIESESNGAELERRPSGGTLKNVEGPAR